MDRATLPTISSDSFLEEKKVDLRIGEKLKILWKEIAHLFPARINEERVPVSTWRRELLARRSAGHYCLRILGATTLPLFNKHLP